jgi:hypothetical protein
VGQMAKTWFGYKSERVKAYTKEIKLFNAFSTINTIINLAFMLGFIGFISFDGLKRLSRSATHSIAVIVVLWSINIVFSVIASPIVFRYQVFIMIVSFIFSILFFDYLIKATKQELSKNINQSKRSNPITAPA